MTDFQEVLSNKISELSEQRIQLRNTVMSPSYHSMSVKKTIENILPEIDDLTGDAEDIKAEMRSVLNQLPRLVEGIWNEAIAEIKALDSDLMRWQEMSKLYDEWQQSLPPEEPTVTNDEKIAAIESGEIQEPTRLSAMRRKSGDKPQITLGQYRRLKSDSGEESET